MKIEKLEALRDKAKEKQDWAEVKRLQAEIRELGVFRKPDRIPGDPPRQLVD